MLTPIWPWEPDIDPTVSTRLSRPCSGILAICRCMWTSYPLFTLLMCHLAGFFVLILPPLAPTQPPNSSHLPSYMHWPNINLYHIKFVKNQPLCTCHVSCTKAVGYILGNGSSVKCGTEI